MKQETAQRLRYVITDYISTNVGWFTFICLRYWFSQELIMSQGFGTLWSFLHAPNVILGQILIPLLSLAIYYASGYYLEPFHKSRTKEFFATLLSSIVITILVFFSVLINDIVPDRITNYELLAILFGCMYIPVYISRATVNTYTNHKLKSGKYAFPTLILGTGEEAKKFIHSEFTGKQHGYRIVGAIPFPGEEPEEICEIPTFSIKDIERITEKHNIKELIIIPTSTSKEELLNIINSLLYLGLNIKLPPTCIEHIAGKIRITPFAGDQLINIGNISISDFEIAMKRIIDISGAGIALALTSPLILLSMLMIKMESKGKVIYTQERIGYRNRPFKIFKLRTMIENAESDGTPRLSLESDPRITKVGNILRKYRIDELPQFINVIKGDMSLVGPRPERQYFIDRIMEQAPNYTLLHSIRPGVTSLGMVKYGYATDVSGMVERMKYDIIYIQNMSLLTDFQIMLSTIGTVIRGKGQ